MALVDPYSPCPCGSEKKYKWCCHKVDPYIERVQRLAENGQTDAAISVLNEGLAKVPDSPLLLIRKAVILVLQQKLKEARPLVESVLHHQPDHAGATVLLIRLILATEGPVAAASQFQHALVTHASGSSPAAGQACFVPG